MRILIVSQYFWPESFRINELAVELKQRGHEITVLTGLPNYPSGKIQSGYGFFKKHLEDYQGVRIVRSPLTPRFAGKGWQLALNYLSFAALATLTGILRCRDHYDVIFVYEPSPITVGFPAIVIKWLKRVPIVFWVQDLWPESLSATGAVRSSFLLEQVRKMVRFIYRHCDLILAQSKAFIPEIRKLDTPEDRVQYYPNSAEKLYRPLVLANDTRERSLMPSGFKVMFAGNIGAAQDFDTILEAATLLKDQKHIHWMILGDGRLKSWVETEIPKRGLQDTFHLLGRYPVEDMPKFFSLADALLVTLKNDPIFSLTIPSKVQSYLACGKPIIAGLNGEGARVVEEAGAGVTCAPSRPAELAKAVLRMSALTNEQRKKMSESGLVYFRENFEPDMLVRKLEELIERTTRISPKP